MVDRLDSGGFSIHLTREGREHTFEFSKDGRLVLPNGDIYEISVLSGKTAINLESFDGEQLKKIGNLCFDAIRDINVDFKEAVITTETITVDGKPLGEMSATVKQQAEKVNEFAMAVLGKQKEVQKMGPPCGIPNIGNSCYLNSALQALMMVPEFKERLLSDDWEVFKEIKHFGAIDLSKISQGKSTTFLEVIDNWKSIDNIKHYTLSKEDINQFNEQERKVVQKCLTDYKHAKELQTSLQKMINDLDSRADHEVIKGSVEALRQALFNTKIIEKLKDQQDAQEVLNQLLSKIGGADFTLKETKKYSDRGGEHVTEEPMKMMPVTMTISGQNPVKMQELLELTFADASTKVLLEPVKRNGNEYYEWTESTKISSEPPKHLFLHLKRFNADADLTRINNALEMPDNGILDLSCAFENEDKEKVSYKIAGAVIQRGNLEDGHYVSVRKKEDNWYLMDDSKVSELSVPEGKVYPDILSEAYIVILERF